MVCWTVFEKKHSAVSQNLFTAKDAEIAKESKAILSREGSIAPRMSTATADAMVKLFFDNQQLEVSAQPSVASPKRVLCSCFRGRGARAGHALNGHR